MMACLLAALSPHSSPGVVVEDGGTLPDAHRGDDPHLVPAEHDPGVGHAVVVHQAGPGEQADGAGGGHLLASTGGLETVGQQDPDNPLDLGLVHILQVEVEDGLHHGLQVLGPGAPPLQLGEVILQGEDLVVQISVGRLQAEESERGHSRQRETWLPATDMQAMFDHN